MPTAKNYVTNVGLVINRYAIASSVVNKITLPRSNFTMFSLIHVTGMDIFGLDRYLRLLFLFTKVGRN